jgi:hypothetical protein
MTERTILFVVVGLLLTVPAWANGLTCRQDCTAEACLQTACVIEKAGTGSCRCAGGAIPWAEDTYASWCRTWSRPAANQACTPAPSAEELENARGAVPGLGQPDLRLADSKAMLDLLAIKNPYVSTLVGVLIEDGSWVEGPIEGEIHDSRFDEATATLVHAPALRLAGLVVTGGVGAAQVQLSVAGDLGSLVHLRDLALAAAPSSLVPSGLMGTVTDRGVHGTLVVTTADGKSQTVQW